MPGSKTFFGKYHSKAYINERRHLRGLLGYYIKYIPMSWGVRLGLSSGILTRYGVELTPNVFDATFRTCCEGGYGTFLTSYLVDYEKPFIMLDIGANQGLFSLLAAQNTNCQQVIAFEPVANTFQLLEQNIELNLAASRIKTVQAAVSDHTGQAKIFLSKTHSGGASLSQNTVHSDEKTEEIQTISAQQLDEMITDEIDIVIKLNAEGHEETVIKEVIKTSFFPRVQSIFYERDVRWSDPNMLKNLLEEQGFKSFKRVGHEPRLDVLASREPDET
ncbi:FkbM family methyltransferase [Pseudovibrio ascidiaceicola]|uniref:FkbM family methyltransferase n=1 Tax=Pseudovibrio ascidiaceicola TaxID=285279 RepID=UPI000D694CC9|nr:FkbM family methyltransferase [Pseudovibrio ascidiaceicola]